MLAEHVQTFIESLCAKYTLYIEICSADDDDDKLKFSRKLFQCEICSMCIRLGSCTHTQLYCAAIPINSKTCHIIYEIFVNKCRLAFLTHIFRDFSVKFQGLDEGKNGMIDYMSTLLY